MLNQKEWKTKMSKLKILNSRKTKAILDSIEKQFNTRLELDCAFLQNRDGKIYIINRDISRIDEEKLRIDSIGLYIGTITAELFRPSIEGSQIIGKNAKKNVIEIDKGQKSLWLRGYELETKEKDLYGFVIIRHGNDFMGSGKIKLGKILNYVPKARRINASDI